MTIKAWALGLGMSVQGARWMLQAGRVKGAHKVELGHHGGRPQWFILKGTRWPERMKPGRKAKRVSI
jgi:hypothetical protein